jgi:putative Holliday junction resolvase
VSRVLGVDLGSRRIGVAVSDPTGTVATPLETIPHRSLQEDAAQVARLGRDHLAERIVVGLPRRLDGTVGTAARRAQAFVRALKQLTEIPVVLWDERLSTVAAERALLEGGVRRARRRDVRDRVAAAIILQGYLEATRARGPAGKALPE